MQTLLPIDIYEVHSGTVGQVAGPDLHAGVTAPADERVKRVIRPG